MNAKKAKAVRRMMRRQRNKIIGDFMDRICGLSLWHRFKIAMMIIFVKREKYRK
jgi:hypothetical protein